MNEIISGLDCIVVYIDDLLIYTKNKTREEHDEIVWQILERLRDHDLFVKPLKCFFGVSEVEFLGLWINKDGVTMDKKKVQALLD